MAGGKKREERRPLGVGRVRGAGGWIRKMLRPGCCNAPRTRGETRWEAGRCQASLSRPEYRSLMKRPVSPAEGGFMYHKKNFTTLLPRTTLGRPPIPPLGCLFSFFLLHWARDWRALLALTQAHTRILTTLTCIPRRRISQDKTVAQHDSHGRQGAAESKRKQLSTADRLDIGRCAGGRLTVPPSS